MLLILWDTDTQTFIRTQIHALLRATETDVNNGFQSVVYIQVHNDTPNLVNFLKFHKPKMEKNIYVSNGTSAKDEIIECG